MVKPQVAIDELSTDERLRLIEQLWDSLDDGDIPLTAAQREELDDRLDRLDREGATGLPWSRVRDEMSKPSK